MSRRSSHAMGKAFRDRTALAAHELHFGPNMTPMVDVVMVILIFFMASTALLGPEWFIDAHLPEDETVGIVQDERFTLPEVRLEVTLTASEGGGSARVSGFGIEGGTLDELARAAAAVAPDLLAGDDPIVVISPGDGVAYQDVVRAHDACTAAGFTRVGLR
ncbi:MAG: hypothetical protein DHS20C14_07670 [Phycisphaeraceae bacterium]|nr:MAG: hypothetical protein DHS20C14_07670 [Phycisphaeraceae bacterium]